MKLLIVEDEKEFVQPLIKALIRHNYMVDWAEDGTKGYRLGVQNEYDCIILDINLPFIDGLSVCDKLRQEGIGTPILMLTARSSIEDKVTGFTYGADDYLVKPFELQELFARIKALIRRSSLNKENILEYKNLMLYPDKLKVEVNGNDVILTSKESALLEYLLRNKGKIVTAEELLEHVWDSSIDVFTQTVKTHIKTLRKKMDKNKNIIKTMKGAGYVIE